MVLKQHSIHVNDLKMSYWDSENTDAIQTYVLLAPGAWDGGFFQDFLDQFTNPEIRFIAPDYIGRGGSDEVKAFDTIELVAKYTSELLRALKLRKLTMIGTSFGTMVTNEIVKTDFEELISKVVLIAPGEYISDFQRVLLKAVFYPARYSKRIQNMYRNFLVKNFDAFKDFPKKKIGSINEQWISTLNYKLDFTSPVELPTLIVQFSDDTLQQKNSLKKLRTFYPNNKVMEIDVTHVLTFDLEKSLNDVKKALPSIINAINEF